MTYISTRSRRLPRHVCHLLEHFNYNDVIRRARDGCFNRATRLSSSRRSPTTDTTATRSSTTMTLFDALATVASTARHVCHLRRVRRRLIQRRHALQLLQRLFRRSRRLLQLRHVFNFYFLTVTAVLLLLFPRRDASAAPYTTTPSSTTYWRRSVLYDRQRRRLCVHYDDCIARFEGRVSEFPPAFVLCLRAPLRCVSLLLQPRALPPPHTPRGGGGTPPTAQYFYCGLNNKIKISKKKKGKRKIINLNED
jgi:hypothetical protein